MALANAKPKFEDESGAGAQTATAEVPAPQATVINDVSPTKAAAEASTAIAKAAATDVVVAAKFGDVYKKYENVIDDLEFGTVARCVGSNGRIVAKKDSKKIPLGDTIKVTLVSFNDSFQVSPGKDSDEAKKLVKYSRDGVTIDGTGEDVKAYVTKLRETDGYPDASVKQYTSLVGILETASDTSAEAQALVGDMVEVSLSPTAGKAFKGVRMQRSVKVSRGILQADGSEANLVVRAEVRTNGANEYTALAVSEK